MASTPFEPPAPPSRPPAESIVHRRWRYLKDRCAAVSVWFGGLSVIGALLLIFVYLLGEILPLFSPPHAQPVTDRPLAEARAARTLALAADERGRVAMLAGSDASIRFVDLSDGSLRLSESLPLPAVDRIVEVDRDKGVLAAEHGDRLLLFAQRYDISFADGKLSVHPGLEYPYGRTPMAMPGGAARALAVRDLDDQLVVAALGEDGLLHFQRYEKTSSFLSDEVTLSPVDPVAIRPRVAADRVLLNPLLNWIYLIDDAAGQLDVWRVHPDGRIAPLQLVELGAPVVDATLLAGGVSVVVAMVDGQVAQLFPARRPEGGWHVPVVRRFRLPQGAQPTALGSELRRRVFAVGDAAGQVHLFHATAERHLMTLSVGEGAVDAVAFNPRAQRMLTLDAGGVLHVHEMHNEHPEVSLKSLWLPVWYEGYEAPELRWQSSAANADFEPKFSLTPLSFGTIKAAFYAMLFAIPLAILGAIYTANFMSPQMRQWVKPTVELMEALPTVILGFLAGLWLAPFVEEHLAGVFLLLLLMPPAVVLAGYLWQKLPSAVRWRVPAGWEGALLVPVVLLVGWLSFVSAIPLELYLFDGNLQGWLDREFGIGYDQRNALVVGIAMGVAVIPTIFSIAEDAIFSVPKHLTLGSLALGATMWQTLVRVVLPTASPAIFSAVMIGTGRAVGETMIVLMATGNTPVMDFSIFQGMRTLSANIAVEMPESEVGSTHFRLLFLAAFVLFVFTFLFNTGAEMIRQRLRRKYASI